MTLPIKEFKMKKSIFKDLEIGTKHQVDVGSLRPVLVEIVEILPTEYKIKYLESPNNRFEYLPKELFDSEE